MDKFIKANSLKMFPHLPIGAVSSPKHCAMHVALEELFYMDGTDVLVVGVGECAYYSRKNLFPNGRLNWAYELSDREVVFGDIGGVETALRMMAESGRKVVCISTCIPSLTGLDLVSLCDKTGAIYLSAADYERIDPSDILEDLYSVLFAGFPAGSQGGKSVWRGTPASISAAADLLKAEKHIICERKYRKMLSEKAKKYNIYIFDDTYFHPLADYVGARTKLDISGEEMIEMERLADNLRGSRWNIRSARALSLASFLRSCGAECSFLIQAGFTRTEYEICRTLGETQICINAAEALPSADDVKTLDLVDEENKKGVRFGFRELLHLLQRMVALCR